MKINSVVKIVSIDAHDKERFIETGQGGIVTSLEDDGVRITWCTVNDVNPDNDATDDYFLYFDQVQVI